MDLLKLLYSPKGKINRSYYAVVHLINIVIPISSYFILFFLNISTEFDGNELFLNTMFWLVLLNFTISITFAQIKRFRDLGMSGASIFWLFVPLVNVIFYCYLFFGESENPKNLVS